MKLSRSLVLFTAGIILSVFVLFSAPVSAQCGDKQVTVILSLDGFRWDYPEKTNTPTLDRIAKEGVKAVSLIPSFPTKTFPNHYTLATGLYPDHHGIVNNSFYDPELDRPYSMGNEKGRFNPVFYGGEPIWITAGKQGVRTASFFWVGSDVEIMGQHPDYWKTYDGKVSFAERTDTIVKWLGLPPALRPRLILAYYEEPDHTGHEYGPGDPRTFEKVHEIDSLTGVLYDRILSLPDGGCVNFIVVSDHGMGAISSERYISLNDYIPRNWPVRIEGGNPIFNVYTEGGWTDSVFNALKKAKHLGVWKSSDVPSRLNYGKNPRDGSIIVVADSAWNVGLKRPLIHSGGGTHGYDNRNTDMHAIFYASGPAFKKEYIQPSFKNVDIYSILSYILGIEPAKTDGSLKDVEGMFNSQP